MNRPIRPGDYVSIRELSSDESSNNLSNIYQIESINTIDNGYQITLKSESDDEILTLIKSFDQYYIVDSINQYEIEFLSSISKKDLIKTQVKVGIVGSRDYHNYDEFKSIVDHDLKEWNLDDVIIVSGGAKGADSLARRYSLETYNVQPIEFLPDWSKGKWAGLARNNDIVEVSEYMIAFPSRNGRGTQDSIRKFQKKPNGQNLKIHQID